MSLSRIIGIIGSAAGVGVFVGQWIAGFKPGLGQTITTIALGVVAFAERIQGGKSKAQ